MFIHSTSQATLLALLTSIFTPITPTIVATAPPQDAISSTPSTSTLTTSSTTLPYPYDYSTLHCPTNGTTTLLTPTYGIEGSVFTVCSEVTIAAPATLVRHAVLDFNSYPRWNTFVVSVSLPSNVTNTPLDEYAGMPMTFTTTGLLAGLNTTSNEVLTNLDYLGIGAGLRPYLLVSWRYDDKLGGLNARAEHPVVIVDLGLGFSRVLSYETFYVGLLTPTIALLKEKQQAQFDAQAADLKAYVEGVL